MNDTTVFMGFIEDHFRDDLHSNSMDDDFDRLCRMLDQSVQRGRMSGAQADDLRNIAESRLLRCEFGRKCFR